MKDGDPNHFFRPEVATSLHGITPFLRNIRIPHELPEVVGVRLFLNPDIYIQPAGVPVNV